MNQEKDLPDAELAVLLARLSRILRLSVRTEVEQGHTVHVTVELFSDVEQSGERLTICSGSSRFPLQRG